MKTSLKKLIEERDRLAQDLANDPSPVDFTGKELPKEPTAYMVELNRKISVLQKGLR